MLPELVNITNAMREAAREGGILNAIFVGLGGVASVAFGQTEIAKAKDEVEDLTEKVEDLREKVTTGKAPIPFLPFDLKFNDEALGKLKSSLVEAEEQLSAAQKRLQALLAPVMPEKKEPEKPTAEQERIAQALAGGPKDKLPKRSGAEKAAREALAALKAQIEGSLRLLQDANERALRDLDAHLADQTISFNDYYAERVRLEQGAIDAEIAAREEELRAAGDNAAERRRIETDLEVLRRKRADVAIKAARDEAKAEEDVNRTVRELRARLLEARGQPLEARRLQIEEEIQRIRAGIQGEIPPAVVEIIAQLRGTELARAEFEELQRQLEEIETRRNLREQSIVAETETKLFGEFEQRSRLVELYQQTAAAIDQVLPRLQALAAANPNLPEIGRAVEEAETELMRLRATSDQTALEIGKAVKGGLSGLFDDLISGTKTAKDAFADFGKSVLDSINRIIAEKLAEQLFGSIFGVRGGKGGGSVGEIFSFLGSLFGFAHGGLVQGPGTSTSDSIPARLSAGEYVLRAEAVRRLGTSLLDALNGGTLSRGPRLALADGGLVLPAETARGTGVGGTVVNMTVVTQDAQSFRKSQGQIMADLATGIARARRTLP